MQKFCGKSKACCRCREKMRSKTRQSLLLIRKRLDAEHPNLRFKSINGSLEPFILSERGLLVQPSNGVVRVGD